MLTKQVITRLSLTELLVRGYDRKINVTNPESSGCHIFAGSTPNISVLICDVKL